MQEEREAERPIYRNRGSRRNERRKNYGGQSFVWLTCVLYQKGYIELFETFVPIRNEGGVV
jgi:hypothetical protein